MPRGSFEMRSWFMRSGWTFPGWFNMELSNEASISLSNRCYDHCKNVFYWFSWKQLSGKHIPSSKSCNLTWTQTDQHYWRKFVTKLHLVSTAKDKHPSIRVKIHQTFFSHYLPYICWVDVIYLTCFVFLKSPWSLVWIFCALNSLT